MQLAAIGECMLEFSAIGKEQFQLDFAGDTYNTAVYFQRFSEKAKQQVEYITALGDDLYSKKILAACRKEKIGTEYIRQIPNQLPGLYLINVDPEGERHFYYYRSEAPARNMFAGKEGDELIRKLFNFDAIYFSGITLAILLPESQDKLFELLAECKRRGKMICFDGNYRPRLWLNVEVARQKMQQALAYVDIALPSFDDEELLFNDTSVQVTAKRLADYGVNEIIVKCGAQGYLLKTPDQEEWVPVLPIKPVDTTGAGDAFNGAYLAQRFSGGTAQMAAAFAAHVAATVIQHRGAIIPRAEMKK